MKNSLGTMIHGCAATEHLDSSGERLSIKGLDISSLPVDGLLNYEHKSDTPAQIVGKILKAKKIFSDKDCESEQELYFWNKVQAPFVYIIGELFDKVGHTGAKEVAALLKYDSEARKASRPGKNIVNFSIEGSKLNKEGQEITKSLARKVTITALPCNKQAIAEEYIPSDKEVSDMEKSFSGVEILQKDAKVIKFPTLTPPAKQVSPSTPAQPSLVPPKTINKQPKKLPWWADTQADVDKFKQKQKDLKVQDRQKASGFALAQAPSMPAAPVSLKTNKLFNPETSGKIDYKNVKKSLTAGSGLAAPSAKVGGDALASENLDRDMKKVSSFSKFLKFVKDKYPEMTKDEAEAMAKYFIAKSMIKAEEALEKMVGEDLDKSKNAREQKRKIFGTDPNAPRLSEKRKKMMSQIKDFAEKKFKMPMTIAGGKRDASGKMREDKDNQPSFDIFSPKGIEQEKQLSQEYKQKGIKRVDPKPDWRSGKLETQPSPDAAVHELAHLYLAPEGMTPGMFQEEMDRLWGESQKKYGHMQQKKTYGEIQPMAVENPIRRELGLPANRTTKPVKQQERALDYEGDRFVEGKDPKGKKVFYDRQSRLMQPEVKERVQQVREGSLKFHPEAGWFKDDSPDTLINLRGRGQTQEAKARAEQRYTKPIIPKKMAASELAKGAHGNWQNEGYTLHHEHNPDIDQHRVTAKTKSGEIAGSFIFENNKGKWMPTSIQVKEPHRRKGLATAAMKLFEQKTKQNLNPHVSRSGESKQSPDAQALWNQPNRPFGKSQDKKDLSNRSIRDIVTSMSRKASAMKHPIKGVHAPTSEKEGQSVAGELSQYGKPGSIMDMRPQAKKLHREKLKELKEMPKPNLPKSENLNKSEKLKQFMNKVESKKQLEHYSSTSGLKTIDPKFKQTGVDRNAKRRDTEHPHSFYYVAGTKPEDIVRTGARSKYTIDLPEDSKIYDISKDPMNFVQTVKENNNGAFNMDMMHQLIKETGHHGFTASEHPMQQMRNVVALYHPATVSNEENI